MLANANATSIVSGWLPPDQYSSLFYSPAASDQSGIFETSGPKTQQQQQQQQQQLQQMVQHNKEETSMALSPPFLGIGPCHSDVQQQQQSLPSSHHHTPFHPAVVAPSSSSASYPIIAAAYQSQCQNHLANFVQSAFGIQTAPVTAMGGPTILPTIATNAITGDHHRPRMPTKKKPKPVPEEKKDQAYKERRRKNNDSAKRSREQRRRKEEETQLRNAELEKENAQLRHDCAQLQCELQRRLFELNQMRVLLEVSSKQKQIIA